MFFPRLQVGEIKKKNLPCPPMFQSTIGKKPGAQRMMLGDELSGGFLS